MADLNALFIKVISGMERKENDDTLRQALLSAGYRLVLKRGFDTLSVAAIAEESIASVAEFDRLFTSKTAFGCTLLTDYMRDYGARLDVMFAPDAGSPRTRLIHYWTAWITDPDLGGWAERCLVIRLSSETALLPDEMRSLLRDGVNRLQLRLSCLIEAGQRDGSIADGIEPETLAHMLYQMWLGASLVTRLDDHGKAPLHRALIATQHLLDMRRTKRDDTPPTSFAKFSESSH